MFSNSIIEYFCCDEHNDAYVAAKARARGQDSEWTPEVHDCLNAITTHLADIRTKSEK